MSTAMFPFAVWQSGTNENSIPANDNALRSQVLMGAAVAFAAVEPVSPADNAQYIVSTAWGGFGVGHVVVRRSGGWYGFLPFLGWVKSVAGNLWFYNGAAWVAGAGVAEGDVVGPAVSVADRIAVFDGTTGKLLKDGGKTIAELRAPAVQSVNSSATVTPAFGNDLVKITAQAVALTLANPSGTAIDGIGIVIRIKDNGTARAISYGTQYRAIGVTLPATTVASKTLYLGGVWNAEDTTFDVIAVGQQA